jgi:hypothetical protein
MGILAAAAPEFSGPLALGRLVLFLRLLIQSSPRFVGASYREIMRRRIAIQVFLLQVKRSRQNK